MLSAYSGSISSDDRRTDRTMAKKRKPKMFSLPDREAEVKAHEVVMLSDISSTANTSSRPGASAASRVSSGRLCSDWYGGDR